MIVGQKKKAFTFFEVITVVIIIGLLFVLLVSRIDWSGGQAKATATQTQLMVYQTVLQDICATNKGFPGTVELLAAKINGMGFDGAETVTAVDENQNAIAESVDKDQWGNPFRLYLSTQDGEGIAVLVLCAGLDGKYLTSDDMSCTVSYDTSGVYPRVSSSDIADGEVHLESGWLITKEPTCTEAGERRKVCTLCGKLMETETVEASHSPVVVQARAPTCTQDGCTEGVRCAKCGMTLTIADVIPAAGHQYTDTVIAGITVRKCSVCGYEYVVGDDADRDIWKETEAAAKVTEP